MTTMNNDDNTNTENSVPVFKFGFGTFVEVEPHGFRGRIYKCHTECPESAEWRAEQAVPLEGQYAEGKGFWYSVLVNDGGAVVVPESYLHAIVPFPFHHPYAAAHFQPVQKTRELWQALQAANVLRDYSAWYMSCGEDNDSYEILAEAAYDYVQHAEGTPPVPSETDSCVYLVNYRLRRNQDLFRPEVRPARCVDIFIGKKVKLPYLVLDLNGTLYGLIRPGEGDVQMWRIPEDLPISPTKEEIFSRPPVIVPADELADAGEGPYLQDELSCLWSLVTDILTPLCGCHRLVDCPGYEPPAPAIIDAPLPPVVAMPGIHMAADDFLWLVEMRKELDEMKPHLRPEFQTTEVTFIVAGMETMKSPFLALKWGEKRYFLIERRNADGEWDALPYEAPDDVEDYNDMQLLRTLAGIGEYADEVPLSTFINPEHDDDGYYAMVLHQWFAETLFCYRDRISPGALLDS